METLEKQLELCEHCKFYHEYHPSAHCSKYLDIELPCKSWKQKANTSANNARFYADRCFELEQLLMEVTDCSFSMAQNNWFERRDKLMQ